MIAQSSAVDSANVENVARALSFIVLSIMRSGQPATPQ